MRMKGFAWSNIDFIVQNYLGGNNLSLICDLISGFNFTLQTQCSAIWSTAAPSCDCWNRNSWEQSVKTPLGWVPDPQYFSLSNDMCHM